jgi:hypothetical protein
MAWGKMKRFPRNPAVPMTSNDKQFDDLVKHFVSKGFTQDEAEYNTTEWTGLRKPVRSNDGKGRLE